MRITKTLLPSLLAVLLTFSANAQDIHFSMFDFAPLSLNPANTGAYEGTFRVGGIYRDQWNMFGVKGFNTPSGYIDAPLLRIGENNWLGVGVNVLNDKRGSVGLSNLSAMLNVAGHFSLTKNRKVMLDVGIGGGFTQEKLDVNAATFQDGYDPNLNYQPGYQDPGLSNNAKTSYPDFQAGLMVNTIVNSGINFNVGFSSQHLLEPDEALVTNSTDGKRFRKYIGHAAANFDLTRRLTLTPQVFYQLQQKASELNLQTLLGIHLSQAKDATFIVGAAYRLDDAAIARLGFNYKGFKLGAAWDFNVSSLSDASNSKGGFEIGLSYIAKIYRTRVLPNRVLCPRF